MPTLYFLLLLCGMYIMLEYGLLTHLQEMLMELIFMNYSYK